MAREHLRFKPGHNWKSMEKYILLAKRLKLGFADAHHPINIIPHIIIIAARMSSFTRLSPLTL